MLNGIGNEYEAYDIKFGEVNVFALEVRNANFYQAHKFFVDFEPTDENIAALFKDFENPNPSVTWIEPLTEMPLSPAEIKDGGTGATTAEQALANLGAAEADHTHDGYAPASHSHSGYAASSHTHSEYAKSSHSHSEYAEENHTHRYSDLDFIPEPKVLWSGASHMNGSQTAALLEPVSYQPKGIVLVFSPYNGTAAVDNAFVSYHISKELVSLQPSKSHTFQMNDADMTTFGFKTLRIGDKNIGGEAVNSTKGAKNGITFDNSKFVLRYVLGE